jgi:hypothetical protein
LPILLNGSGTVPLRHHYVTVPSFPRYGDCKNYGLEQYMGRQLRQRSKWPRLALEGSVFNLWYQRYQMRKSLTPPYCRHSIIKNLNVPR